jgi:hypothetical protein
MDGCEPTADVDAHSERPGAPSPDLLAAYYSNSGSGSSSTSRLAGLNSSSSSRQAGSQSAHLRDELQQSGV